MMLAPLQLTRYAFARRVMFTVAPMDLLTDAFYVTRRPALEARLAQLAAGEGPALVAEVDCRYRGIRCTGVAWDAFSSEALAGLVQV